jgi:predicted MFS family arabinose efflux permease
VAIVATIGVAWCFTLNGLSFFLVVLALMALHLPPHVPPSTPRALGDELRGGLAFVRDTPLMRSLSLLVLVSTFLAMPILTMLPAFATDVLTGAGSPSSRLSLLMASQGLGAVVGALLIGTISHRHLGRMLLGVQFALGLLIAAFALSTSLPLSVAVLFLVGIFFMALFSISFSLVQLAVPDALRGRVVSIYMVTLRGGGPIGGLVAGALADTFSASSVMAVNGALLAVISISIVAFGWGRHLARA